MDYYNNNSNYYQSEMMNSPQQQQSYYPYSPNYRHSQQQGRYGNRSRRNSSRAQSMVMDQSAYYDEEGPQSPYSRSGYYDQPLIKYRRPSSSYYKNEEESVSSPYYMTSPPDYYQYQQQHYASPPKNNSSRIARSNENKQKYNDYPITPEEGRSFIYTDEEEMNHAGDNETYQEEEMKITGATTLTSAYTEYNDQDDIYQGDEDEDEEEEEEDQDPTTQRNTMLNAESNVMMNSAHTSPHESFAGSSTLYDSQPLSIADPQKQQEQQQGKKTWFKNVVNSALVLKRKVKMLRKRDSMTIEQGSLLHQPQQQPSIQFITATNNELLGDVLDAQQEKEILSQLSSPTATPSSSFNMSPEKTKITNLDRIWVFRLIDSNQPLPDSNTIAWIGFDYDNQLLIENHLKQLSNLPENERFAVFYDSHIRYGKMPVIVTPSESKGYYFANEEQTDLIMLQVTFIENNHEKVTFVYRV